MNTDIFTAIFPSVKQARIFAARIGGGGWSATAVVQIGRKVEWVSTSDSDFYFSDMLETVGYFGSTQGRKATLNGVKAPVGY